MNEYVGKNIIHTFYLVLSICKENCHVKAWKCSVMFFQMGSNVLRYFPTQHVSALKCTTNVILQLITAALAVTVNKTRHNSGQQLLSKQILTGLHATPHLILLKWLWALTTRARLSFFPCATSTTIFLLAAFTQSLSAWWVCQFSPGTWKDSSVPAAKTILSPISASCITHLFGSLCNSSFLHHFALYFWGPGCYLCSWLNAAMFLKKHMHVCSFFFLFPHSYPLCLQGSHMIFLQALSSRSLAMLTRLAPCLCHWAIVYIPLPFLQVYFSMTHS